MQYSYIHNIYIHSYDLRNTSPSLGIAPPGSTSPTMQSARSRSGLRCNSASRRKIGGTSFAPKICAGRPEVVRR